MPTYEYACESCQQVTEAYQSFNDAPLVECPHCGGKLNRVFHPVGIMFKGTGFYSTDAKTSKQSNGQKKDKSSESKSTSDSGSSTSQSGSASKSSETKP